MTRLSVLPDPAFSFPFIGDLHVPHVTSPRTNKLLAAFTSGLMPLPSFILQAGDSVDDGGAGTEDQTCQALYAQIVAATGASFRTMPGNHDTNGVRSTAAWAASFANYLEGGVYPWTKDLGYVRIIAVGDLDPGTQPGDPAPGRPYLPQSHLDYLDAALTAANGQDCWIASHAPLYNTVLGKTAGDNPQWISTEPFFFAHAPLSTSADDTAIRAVLAAHANAKAWLCGHVHSSRYAPGFLSTLTIGGRQFAHINSSAIYYVGRTNEQLTDPIILPWLSKVGNSIQVRFFDAGNSCWTGIGASRVPTVTYS